MDPSASLCIVYDSLKELTPIPTPSVNEGWYVNDVTGADKHKLTPQYNLHSITTNPEIVNIDVQRYTILQRVKDAFDTEAYLEARDAMNPFENIGRSKFINRAAVKLANIDAVHHITKEIFTFDRKQSEKTFTFCDVAAGPGGFTQYLQYRYPNSKGYGMTLRSEKLDWNTRFLDMNRFTPFYGQDNTGDLYTNWEQFIKYVLSQTPEGVDLVTADGGFDLEDPRDKTLLHRQEFLSSRLLLTQALVGIGCTKIGGNFVVKVFDTVTNISAYILFVLAQCFQRILIFKPVSSRPANAERYVLCMNRKADVQSYYQLLAQAANTYQNDMYLSSLFNEPIPPLFREWLTLANQQSIDRQLQSAQHILLYIQGKPPTISQYNIPKFLTIWNLPDTPIDPRYSKLA